MTDETHEIPDDSIAREYEMVATAESNAPPQMLAEIAEFDARAEQLAPERDRELATEAYLA